jgi:hypothetical protein
MSRLLFIIILPLLISGCISEYGKPSAGVPTVPLVDLLNDPARWNGQKIQVGGFFNYELEGDAIYLSKADLKQRNLKKAVSLGLDDPVLQIQYGARDKTSKWRQFLVSLSLRLHKGKPVAATGVFEIKPFGGLNLGHIEVSQLVQQETPRLCRGTSKV